MEEYLANIDFLNLLEPASYPPMDDSCSLPFRSLLDSPFPNIPCDPISALQADKRELPTAEASSGVRREEPVRGASVGEVWFAWEVRERRGRVRQGGKDDTVELNINFKTILAGHLRSRLLANELSPRQAQAALAFAQRSPSFRSLAALRSEEVAGVCLELVESSGVAARVLSSRCSIATKLRMLKFLEVLRANLRFGRIRRWKQSH